MKLYDNDVYRDEFMEAVYNLLSGDSSNDRANQVIDLFDAAPAVETEPAPLNDPLTLEELREMDGEPVWVQEIEEPRRGQWRIIKKPWYDVGICLDSCGMLECEDMGKVWLAYRRKPEV